MAIFVMCFFQKICFDPGNVLIAMARYYVFIDTQYGPFELSDLRDLIEQRRFSRDCWVFHKGETADWTRAAEVFSLQSLFLKELTAPKLVAPNFKVTPTKPTLETHLLSGSKAEALRMLELKLPAAPLSDLPSQSKPGHAPVSEVKSGLFRRVKRIFGLS
jgi:hypothetical protein